MDISIVIVNYNVKYFLELCLDSCLAALQQIDGEIIVVDNASSDGSVEFVKENYEDVKLLAQEENLGFSVANNVGIKQCSSEYILILNPDTVLAEDCLEKALDFIKEREDVGALGGMLIDGSGKFLPESKRSLPTPAVAFYKMFGLSKLFPKSRTFGKYHLGYLSNTETNEVDVLAGCFMLVRKSMLDKIGMLDEQFFMYGEDIDLSYRIAKANYKNIYFPESKLIHFKGESTKKDSAKYVTTFYKAMSIFAQKHFVSRKAKLFSLIINIAIALRALLTFFKRFVIRLSGPILDAIILYACMFGVKSFWETYIKSAEGLSYPQLFMEVNVPIYILIWLVFSYLFGAYVKPFKIKLLVKGIFWGTVCISVLYAFVDESLRFSRSLILVGAVISILVLSIIKLFITNRNKQSNLLDGNARHSYLVVGSETAKNKIWKFYSSFSLKSSCIGFVSDNSASALGSLEQLEEVVDIHKPSEIVFSTELSYSEIISNFQKLAERQGNLLIHTSSGLSVLGSNSVNHPGAVITEMYHYAFNLPFNRRLRRLNQSFISVLLLLFFPISLIIFPKGLKLLKAMWQTLFSKAEFFVTGYEVDPPKQALINLSESNDTLLKNMSLHYAKEYRASLDWIYLWKLRNFIK